MSRLAGWERLGSGEYARGPWRLSRGWADAPGTDRRRQTWVLCRMRPTGSDGELVAEIRGEAEAAWVMADVVERAERAAAETIDPLVEGFRERQGRDPDRGELLELLEAQRQEISRELDREYAELAESLRE